MLQWVFDANGIEAPDEDFFIPRDRINQLRPERGLYDLPLHVAEKDWCRMDHFIAVFFEAIHVLASESGQTVDARMLANTFREALRIAAVEPRRYRAKWDPTERQDR
jgi:hypothetical protein